MLKKTILFFTLTFLLTISMNSLAQFGKLLKKAQSTDHNSTEGKEGKLIFAHTEFESFDAAAPHAIDEVKDGEEVWIYVKLSKPIGNYTNVQKFTDNEGNLVENVSFMIQFSSRGNSSGKFSEQPVFVKGGEKGERGMVINKGYVAYLDDIDLEKTTEFKMCLSKYIRHKSSFVFLKPIGGGNAGTWDTEIRLKGKNDNVFASGGLMSNLANGIPNYRKAWKAYEQIIQNGDIADNVLPPTGKFNDASVKAAVIKEAKASGIVAEKIVFTTDAWAETINPNDAYQRKERHVFGYITYKNGEQCMYSMAEATQTLVSGNWSASSVKLYNTGTPILCSMTK